MTFCPKKLISSSSSGDAGRLSLSPCAGGGVLRILQQVVDPGRRCGIPLVRGAFLQLVHLEPLVPPPQMSQVLIGSFLLQEVDLHKQVQPDIVK